MVGNQRIAMYFLWAILLRKTVDIFYKTTVPKQGTRKLLEAK